MLGHWTMAVVVRRDDGWDVGNLLGMIRGGWVLTWVFQVMPVFFFVGGFSNAVTLDGLTRRGGGYAEFIAVRARRLLRPVLVLLAVWIPLATAAQLWGRLDPTVLRQATTVVTQPLWFIGIYLIVTALAPPMRQWHRRAGLAVPLILVGGAVGVDVARFALGVPVVGYLNFGFVWLLAHQAGYFHADGSLARLPRWSLGAVAVLALGALAILTSIGPYPRSMVGLPGETVSNMNPPTVCLVPLMTWQLAAVLLVRAPVVAWLARPRVWGAVIATNLNIMTMFLWHLTALMVAALVLLPAGFPQPPVGSAAWWALRPVWLGVLCAVTALFVIVFGRFERGGRDPVRVAHQPVAAALAATFLIVGICGFAVSGLIDFIEPNGRRLIALPVSPLINIVALALGGFLLRAGHRTDLTSQSG